MTELLKKALIVLFMAAIAAATEVKPLTESEKLAVVTAQRDVYSHQSRAAQLRQQADQEDKAVQDAAQALQAVADGIFVSRKLAKQDALICDGPQPGPCADVKVGEIAMRELPKAKPEKK